MKRLICTLLCVILCFSLFGCAAQQEDTPKEQKINTLADTAVVFFETDNDADCALIRFKDSYVLIDTGEKKDGKDIAKYLLDNGIDTLDYIILSHFDKDHCGGATKLLKKVNAKTLLHPEYIKDNDESEKLFELADEIGIETQAVDKKQSIDLDGLSLMLLPAEKHSYPEKESNNSSLVVKAELLQKTILFTGDSEEARVSELLSCNEDLSADILKLMYHGRYVANQIDLLEKIKPSYTVVTGESESKKVKGNIESVEEYIGDYYYTCDGNITFVITEDGITVSQN